MSDDRSAEEDMNPYASPAALPESLDERALIDNETELLRAFVGPRWQVYYRKWGKFRRKEAARPGFNWAAFLFGALWFAYRKMFVAAFVLMAINLSWTLVQELVFMHLNYARFPPALNSGISIALAMVCGLFGNLFYFNRYQRAIAESIAAGYKERELIRELSRRGGVSLLGMLGTFALYTGAGFGLAFVLEFITLEF